MTEQNFVNARHGSYAQTPSKVGGDLRWGQCYQLTYRTGKSSGPLLLLELSGRHGAHVLFPTLSNSEDTQ